MFPAICSLLFDLRTMVEVMKIMATSFKRSHGCLPHSVPPPLQQATADTCLHWKLLDTHRQVWVSLLWGHCSFLLGPGAHKVLFVPSKSLFCQSCVSSGGSMVGLRAASPRGLMPFPGLLHQSPCPCGRPLLTCTSTGDTQTLKGRSGSVSVSQTCHSSRASHPGI